MDPLLSVSRLRREHHLLHALIQLRAIDEVGKTHLQDNLFLEIQRRYGFPILRHLIASFR